MACTAGFSLIPGLSIVITLPSSLLSLVLGLLRLAWGWAWGHPLKFASSLVIGFYLTADATAQATADLTLALEHALQQIRLRLLIDSEGITPRSSVCVVGRHLHYMEVSSFLI